MAFALFAAALYGSADFLGGLASRQARSASVLLLSAPAGAVVMISVALISGVPFQITGLGWALAGGAAGGAGLLVFYAGLAAGPMSVVAPVAALVSTLLPVGVALVDGERASPAVYAGALLCLAAIGLVSMERPRPGATSQRPARGLGYGVVAGIAFGMFFLFLRNAGTAGVLWPVCAARVAAPCPSWPWLPGSASPRPGARQAGRCWWPPSAPVCSTRPRTSATCWPPGPGCSGWRS
jgi:drug/metabolite transporter (DMT)-like permease